MGWVPDDLDNSSVEKLNNVSLGGLAFLSPYTLAKGQQVDVCFPLLNEHRSLTGQVKWSKKHQKGFEIGIQFDDPDELYRLRMIEQICHIEHYRSEIEQQEGRSLSIEEAADEWIKRFAGEFPSLNDDQ